MLYLIIVKLCEAQLAENLNQRAPELNTAF